MFQFTPNGTILTSQIKLLEGEGETPMIETEILYFLNTKVNFHYKYAYTKNARWHLFLFMPHNFIKLNMK